MVQALDKSTTNSVHKGVLQSTEQNSVELLDIVLIGSLTERKRTLCTKISGSVVSLTHLCIIPTYWEPTTILCRDSEPVPAETIHSHAFSHQINKHATGLSWNAFFFLQTYRLSGMSGVVRARFLRLADRLQTYLCAIPTKTVCEVSCGGALLIHKQQTGE